jgi:hypothetical protein
MIIEELRCLEETKVSWIFSFQTIEAREDNYKNQRVLDTFDYVQKKERVKVLLKRVVWCVSPNIFVITLKIKSQSQLILQPGIKFSHLSPRHFITE